MVFGTNHVLDHYYNINLTFNDKVIERVDVFKYLGIKFDSNMSWSSHIDYLSGNVSKRIGIVKRVKYFLPQETLITLANALVFRILIMPAVFGLIVLQLIKHTFKYFTID